MRMAKRTVCRITQLPVFIVNTFSEKTKNVEHKNEPIIRKRLAFLEPVGEVNSIQQIIV